MVVWTTIHRLFSQSHLPPFLRSAAGLFSRPLSANMPSVYIKTYGCQMNERDSEAVAAQLVAKAEGLLLQSQQLK
jgi:hypothetical protein